MRPREDDLIPGFVNKPSPGRGSPDAGRESKIRKGGVVMGMGEYELLGVDAKSWVTIISVNGLLLGAFIAILEVLCRLM